MSLRNTESLVSAGAPLAGLFTLSKILGDEFFRAYPYIDIPFHFLGGLLVVR